MSATMTATQRSPQRESEANTNESTVTGGVSQSQPSGSSMQEDIARLAYALWQERGCPIGSPESDWFEAEQKLVRSAERRESGLTRR
jgi:hypothetical protein